MTHDELLKRAQEWIAKRYGLTTFTLNHKKVMPLCDLPNELTAFAESLAERGAGTEGK